MAGLKQGKMPALAEKGLVVSFVLVMIGAGFSIHGIFAGGGKTPVLDVVLKCAQPDCDYTEIISGDDFLARAREELAAWKESEPAVVEEIKQEIMTGPMRRVAVRIGSSQERAM